MNPSMNIMKLTMFSSSLTISNNISLTFVNKRAFQHKCLSRTRIDIHTKKKSISTQMFVKDTHRHQHKKLLQNKGKTKFTPPPITTHNKILPNLVGKESFTSKHNMHKDLSQNKASSPMSHKNENLANFTCFKNLPQQSVIGLCQKTRLNFFAITHTNMQTLQCDLL
jgi:hypothetical protein